MINKVGLIYTDEYQKYNFGKDHPLRPLRLKLTYSLMEKLSLLNNERIEIMKPRLATQQEIETTHSPKYIEVIKKLSKNPKDNSVVPHRYNLGPGDNPIFEGMYEASALICGASIEAASAVWNNEEIRIAFNPLALSKK